MFPSPGNPWLELLLREIRAEDLLVRIYGHGLASRFTCTEC